MLKETTIDFYYKSELTQKNLTKSHLTITNSNYESFWGETKQIYENNQYQVRKLNLNKSENNHF